ncbi:MAG: SUMF1/EgtB/PvdO family nonheme iron enzyme [Acidobacteriota bacterium]
MNRCSACQREWESHLLFCPHDGQPLLPVNKQDEFIGTLLDDKYRIEEKIGEGGMGKVYKATHTLMGSTVAIKVLHTHSSSDLLTTERFRREAMAASQLRHPNVLLVSDFGVTKDSRTVYLVMEFLEGLTLRETIKLCGQIDYKDALTIIKQTCAAVHAAHLKEIIHRDLKPENIWILKDESGIESVKVLDFGIAKLKSYTEGRTLTQDGMVLGTPNYMSPEQSRGEELDARSDIYSLGIILYEMLTGEVPFRADTPMSVLFKHNNEPPKPMRYHRDDIPEEVEEVVARALAKDRRDRFFSALELAQAFEVSLRRAGLRITSASDSASTGDWGSPSNKTVLPAAALEPSSNQKKAARISSGRLSESGGEHTTIRASPQPPMQGQDEALSSGSVRTASGGRRQRLIFTLSIVFLMAAAAIVLAYVLSRSGSNPLTPPPPEGMTFIKGGAFTMGTDDPATEVINRPASEVKVGDFFMDINEVTNEDYLRFVQQTGYSTPPHWKGGKFDPGKEKFPVTQVSWDDARAYAEWAGKRLPTEAEWEYAARGDKNLIYPWGNTWFPKYCNSSVDEKQGEPVEVGAYKNSVSWCGLFDMAGNVAEWVEDSYKPYPGSSPQASPKGICSQQQCKVFRGGAYSYQLKEDFAMFNRFYDVRGQKERWLGFRCAKDAPRQ